MITRRGFLQALMGLPVIAALPAIGKVVEELPVTEVYGLEQARAEGIVQATNESCATSWLYLDKYPIDCTRVVVEQNRSLVPFLREGLIVFDQGIAYHSIDVDMYYNPLIEVLLRSGEKVNLVARFNHSTVLTARTCIEESSMLIQAHSPIVQSFRARLMDVEWHG